MGRGIRLNKQGGETESLVRHENCQSDSRPKQSCVGWGKPTVAGRQKTKSPWEETSIGTSYCWKTKREGGKTKVIQWAAKTWANWETKAGRIERKGTSVKKRRTKTQTAWDEWGKIKDGPR